MPAPIHVMCIAPVALVSAVQSATTFPGEPGILCDVPLYTAADPIPRTETHRIRSGPVKAQQRAQLDAATVGGEIDATLIDPSFVGVRIVNRPMDLPSPQPALMAEMGLTSSSTL